MFKISSSLLALALMLSSIACASQTNEKRIVANQYFVKAEVYFQPWSTKEYGKLIGSESLTVITSPDKRGDIVVLRKNPASGGFIAEVYRPDADVENPKSWDLTFPEEQKTIDKQADGSFQLSELIDGKEGGRRFEVFRLTRPEH